MKIISYTFTITLCLFLFLSCESKPKIEAPITDSISMDEMIGQMIMVGFRGMNIAAVDSALLTQLDRGLIGSLILFDYDFPTKTYQRNIESPAQVKLLIEGLQARSKSPLFIGIDQEGGVINRLKPKYGFPKSVSAQYLGDLDNLDTTRYYGLRNARTLKDLGFNLNFSPVVDMNVNLENPIIAKYERSYAAKAEGVVKHAKAWIEMHDSIGVLSTLKHFPGHGSSTGDSHKGFTDVTTTWDEVELEPFKQLCQMDYSIAVMTAHVFNKQLDTLYPATLSEKVIKYFLRDQWSFDGLIFSDDLQMKAVNSLFDFETIIKRSIIAGVDILVIGNNLEYDVDISLKIRQTILRLIENKEIDPSRIKASYERIIKAKERLLK